MTILASVDRVDSLFSDAIRRNDADAIRRCGESLKTLLFQSVVTRDSTAIAAIRRSLAGRAEVFELLHDVPMAFDDTAQAWMMRADAGTAVLASRLVPEVGPLAPNDDRKNPVDQILKLLRQANGAIANIDIAQRLGLDTSIISRALGRLAENGLVKQWRSGRFVMNEITSTGRGREIEPIADRSSGSMQLVKRPPPTSGSNAADTTVVKPRRTDLPISIIEDITAAISQSSEIAQRKSNSGSPTPPPAGKLRDALKSIGQQKDKPKFGKQAKGLPFDTAYPSDLIPDRDFHLPEVKYNYA